MGFLCICRSILTIFISLKQSIKSEIELKVKKFEDLKLKFASLKLESPEEDSDTSKMPNYLMQKMEDLMKKWSEFDLATITASTANTTTTAAVQDVQDVQDVQTVPNVPVVSSPISPISPTVPTSTSQTRFETPVSPPEEDISKPLEVMVTMREKSNGVHKLNGSSSGVFNKKTQSSESLKTTTMVTPIEIESSDAISERGDGVIGNGHELNIIKLDGVSGGDQRVVIEPGVAGTNGMGVSDERRSSKVFTFSGELVLGGEEGEKLNLEDRDNLEVISNDLFDWLLWIDHTLETQLVVVGDLDQIEQLVKKYESILNEMSKRQVQLDKLIEVAAGIDETNINERRKLKPPI